MLIVIPLISSPFIVGLIHSVIPFPLFLVSFDLYQPLVLNVFLMMDVTRKPCFLLHDLSMMMILRVMIIDLVAVSFHVRRSTRENPVEEDGNAFLSRES